MTLRHLMCATKGYQIQSVGDELPTDFPIPRPANPVTRPRLLLVGSDIVHKRGYNGCEVQDTTATSGLPKGPFYNYSDSKDALAVEILDAYWSLIKERYSPPLSNRTLKPLLRVRRFFRA